LPSPAIDSAFDVESFLHEYYDAWSGTDLDRIMSYYADDVVLQIPGLFMEGKEAVREQFARPFTTAFPGNHHLVKNVIFGPGVVTVEFSFEAQHTGPFAGHAATGAQISLPGCGVYEYDSEKRQITAGRIYFDVATLLQTMMDLLESDRKKAADALQFNQHNLSLITELIPTFIHVLRTDGSVLYVNQKVLDYHGVTLEEVQKENYRDRFFHPEDVEKVRDERREALLRPVPFENEQRARGKDGTYRWFLIRYNPLLDGQGKVDRWYAAAFDIEDRKRAEDAQVRQVGVRADVSAAFSKPISLAEILSGCTEAIVRHLDAAFARIWTLSKDESVLELQASAGIYTRLDGSYSRIPVGDLKVGLIARQKQAHFTNDVLNDPRVHDKGWAQSNGMVAFAGYPLVVEDRLIGVLALFARSPLPESILDTLASVADTIAQGIERKRAEEALTTALGEIQKSEFKLRQVIDAIPTTAWTTRPDGYCDFLNQVWLDYAGMTAEQARGWGWAEAIHADDREKLIEEWQTSLASGTPVDTEARIRRFDGSYRWFLIRANPLKDESGNILKWYGTCIDIEDRKRGEEVLRVRELSWHQIVDSIPGLVATTSAMGAVEFLNRQTTEYFGRTTEELQDWALIDAVHPDDLPRVIEERKKSIVTGQIYEVEHRCRRADGVYRWFQVRGLPVKNAEGVISAWYLLLTDIDDRKKAEEALQASEQNLSLTLNTIPTFIAVVRPDGKIVWVNDSALAYHGVSLEDVQQEGFASRWFHPDDMERLGEVMVESLKRPRPFEVEYRALGKDGKYRWFLVRYKPLLGHQGRIEQWYVTAFDIEDLKQAEEALRQSENRAHLMVDSIDGQIMTATPTGEVEFVNQQVLDYFGKSLEELKDWRTNDAIHPEDFPRAATLWLHSVETGDPYAVDERLRRADGAYRWFRVRGRCVRDPEGQVVRWYLLLTDIDEGKRAESQVEEAYLRLAEAQRLSKTGSFITDLVADEHDWSDEAFRIFDFDPATKVSVQMIRDMVHPEDLASFDSVIARGIQGEDVDFVFRIVTSRGAVKHLRGMARVIEQVAGRPLFIGALQDITESKVAEEALTTARSELAHMARVTTLSALTASISHEINQPISAAITSAGACVRWLNRAEPDVERARAAATRIEEDGKRAAEILSHLKSFYKKDVSPHREIISINDLVGEMLVLLRSEADRYSVLMRTQLATDLPSVSGDRVQLQQVLMNLMLNGMEAMSERGGELRISTRRHGGDVMASVSDTGHGILTDNMEEIFNTFFTTKADGTGMGLAISRMIIESHDGRLWADKNPGGGAAFHFTLPIESGAH
jgi:PAS domain S-box-containing protein